jgi:hydrogenase 3 maturation protease
MNASSSLGLEQVPMNEKTCLVGMGNTLRRDDAAGVYIVEEVGRRLSGDSLKTQVVEDVLEAYVFQLAELDCENIVIVDAIEASEEPGSVVFGKLSGFSELLSNFSTHKLTLELCGKIFEEHGKETYLLGIVAGDIDFGEGMTKAVKESADMLRDLLITLANAD